MSYGQRDLQASGPRRGWTGSENCGVALTNARPLILLVYQPLQSTCFLSGT
jgi:hypothetical protein